MSKAASVTLAVTVTGDGLNSVDSDTLQNTTTATAPTSVALTGTNTTVAIPTGVSRVKLKPPPTNAFAIVLKGLAADTGIPLAVNEPSYLSFVPGTASFVLSSGGAVSVALFWV